MPKRRQSRYHVTMYDFKDTDLMAKVAEGGAEGLRAREVAEAMGMDDEDGDGTRAIGMRFAWMKRYGMLNQSDSGLWTLTDGADRVMSAQRLAAMTEVIQAVPDESMVEIMAHVTSRYRLGDPMVASLLRREFQYGTSPRSHVWGSTPDRRRRRF